MPNVKNMGIPLEKTGKKLKQLAEAIRDHGMDIGSVYELHTEYGYKGCDKVQSAKITVYFFEEEDLAEEKND